MNPKRPFYDPEANAALFFTLKNCIKQTSTRVIESHPYSINSPEFAQKLLDAFAKVSNFTV
ncbi:MAG: Tm-1-like ATP-binding domain-containing protein [Pirellulales bacterium]